MADLSTANPVCGPSCDKMLRGHLVTRNDPMALAGIDLMLDGDNRPARANQQSTQRSQHGYIQWEGRRPKTLTATDVKVGGRKTFRENNFTNFGKLRLETV